MKKTLLQLTFPPLEDVKASRESGYSGRSLGLTQSNQ